MVSTSIMALSFALGIGLVMLFPRFRKLNWGIWIALVVGLIVDRTAGNLLRAEYLVYEFRQSLEQVLTDQSGSVVMPMDEAEREAFLDALGRIYRTQGRSAAMAAFEQRTDATRPVRLAEATNASREAWVDFAKALSKALAHFEESGASERCVAWLRGEIEVPDSEYRQLGDSATALDNLLRSHRRIEKNFSNEGDSRDIASLSAALTEQGRFSQDDFYLLKKLSGRLSVDESKRLCRAVRAFYDELIKRDPNTVAALTQGIFAPP